MVAELILPVAAIRIQYLAVVVLVAVAETKYVRPILRDQIRQRLMMMAVENRSR